MGTTRTKRIRETGACLGALLGAMGLAGCLGGPAPEPAAWPSCGIGTSPTLREECLLLDDEDLGEEPELGASLEDALADALAADRAAVPLSDRVPNPLP